jgi:MOSC domain-containing protein YiiM
VEQKLEQNIMSVSTAIPLLSLNIGSVQTRFYRGKEARSGIEKTTVDQVLSLTKLGLVGDEQADLEHHGGEDKAICVYSFDHYPRIGRRFLSTRCLMVRSERISQSSV